MHIPDGLLDLVTAGITYITAVIAIGFSITRVKRNISEIELSKLATLSGSIFVAQLIKWPVPGGSTLHFVGGGLAALIVGPWGGLIVMTTVLAIQTFIFHDGGITTFGANIVSAGVAGVWLSYLIFIVLKKLRAPLYISSFISGYISTIATGFVAGFILGVSGEILRSEVYNLRITPYVMILTHSLLGLLEALITMGIIIYLYKKYPLAFYKGVTV